MFDALRKSLAIIAALLFSVGYAVGCPCVAGGAMAHHVHQTSGAGQDRHAFESGHAGHAAAGRDHHQTVPCEKGPRDCAHCNAAALAGSATVGDGLVAPSGSAKPIAFASPFVSPAPRAVSFDASRRRLKWAEPPPLPSPVGLKIRLRN